MQRWVEVSFDCLPLRSIARLDIPIDASPKYRARCERIKAAMEELNPSKRPVTLFSKLRDYLFTGTLVAAPIAITIWLAVSVIDYFDSSVMPLIPAEWNPAN